MPPTFANPDEKNRIDTNLKAYPILWNLCKENPKRYQLTHNPFEREIQSYRFPTPEIKKKFEYDSSMCDIGHLLLHSNEAGNPFLDLVESIFAKYPPIQAKYADKLCEKFFPTLSEIKVYDRLCNAGFTPEIEFPITTVINGNDTPSNADFSIMYEGKRYFLEVKLVGSSFQDELAHSGLPARYPQTGFVDPLTGVYDNQTYEQYKTENTIMGAIESQVSKWARSNYTTVPIILMLELVYDYLGISYIVDFNRIARRVAIPPNLAGAFLFGFYPREVAGIYPSTSSASSTKTDWYPVDHVPQYYSRCATCTPSLRCRPHHSVPLSLIDCLKSSFNSLSSSQSLTPSSS